MAKLTQSGKQWESPQIIAEQTATEQFGGMAPSHVDVMRSANARGGKRHDMAHGDRYADENVLPKSGGASLDKDGINDSGYLVKKGLKSGVNAFYNTLPPGMDIEDQENIDSREMTLRTFKGGLSYPGDGGF